MKRTKLFLFLLPILSTVIKKQVDKKTELIILFGKQLIFIVESTLQNISGISFFTHFNEKKNHRSTNAEYFTPFFFKKSGLLFFDLIGLEETKYTPILNSDSKTLRPDERPRCFTRSWYTRETSRGCVYAYSITFKGENMDKNG